MLAALSRVQAMIEFTPQGEILTANDNFLTALGYSLAEIQGSAIRCSAIRHLPEAKNIASSG